MNWLVIMPLVIPLLSGSLNLITQRDPKLQASLMLAGLGALIIFSILLLLSVDQEGILTLQVASWPAPFGISFVADHFSASMVLVSSLIGLMTGIYSLAEIQTDVRVGGYYTVFNILLVGVNGAFLTGDLFNLYVWFEVMLVASYVLLTMGRKKSQVIGAIPYLVLSFISSALFFSAIGLIYGVTGTLNLADLAMKFGDINSGLKIALASLLFIVFGLKAAIFPLYFWLPHGYPPPAVAVTALFSALLTKVGVYSLVRVYTLIFSDSLTSMREIIITISLLTMISGVMGALSKDELKSIFSFHIVSQIGYLTLGLALGSTLGFVGLIYFMIHNIIVKSNLFLISGIAKRYTGSTKLFPIKSIYKDFPFLSILFVVSALSLAGIPPLSGFWGKLMLAKASFDSNEYVAGMVALIAGLLTLTCMLKIWQSSFWNEDQSQLERRFINLGMTERTFYFLPVIILTCFVLTLSFNPSPFIEFFNRASEELTNKHIYINSVMGERP